MGIEIAADSAMRRRNITEIGDELMLESESAQRNIPAISARDPCAGSTKRRDERMPDAAAGASDKNLLSVEPKWAVVGHWWG
jgi:hypothetical protein